MLTKPGPACAGSTVVVGRRRTTVPLGGDRGPEPPGVTSSGPSVSSDASSPPHATRPTTTATAHAATARAGTARPTPRHPRTVPRRPVIRSCVGGERRQVAQPDVVAEDLDRRRQRQAQRALEDAHLGVLVVLDERHGPAVAPGPGRPARPVEVVLGVLRRVVVDDGADVVDVEPASGDVGGDEHGEVALGELAQRPLPRRPAAGRRGSPRRRRRARRSDAATLSHSRLVWQNTASFGTPWPIAPTTRALSMWCTARNRWCIVPTVSVAASMATSTGSLR